MVERIVKNVDEYISFERRKYENEHVLEVFVRGS
jgi:hypothetical protein